jgi:hypothetical protein
MHCESIFFSEHVLTKMAERDIEPEEVETVIKKGEAIRHYPDDQPDPSRLVLGFVNGKALHVVVLRDVVTENCIVITAYEPDPNIWEPDFKTKKIRL